MMSSFNSEPVGGQSMGARKLPFDSQQPPTGQPPANQSRFGSPPVARGIPQGEGQGPKFTGTPSFASAGGYQPSQPGNSAFGQSHNTIQPQIPQQPQGNPMGISPDMWQMLLQYIQKGQGGMNSSRVENPMFGRPMGFPQR